MSEQIDIVYAINSPEFEAESRRIEASISGTERVHVDSCDKIERSYRRAAVGVGVFAAATAAAAAAKELYSFSNNFANSMGEVSTISKAISADLAEYKARVIDMSLEIPVAADSAAKALYQIVSAGHDAADGLSVLRVSARAAIGGVTDTVTAADAITTVLNAYKKRASEAESISDQLFTTARLGKTTFGELGQSISQAVPIAASFGIASEQVLAAVATLTKSGTPTAQAMTQIRASIVAASKTLGDGYFATHTFQQGLSEIAARAGGSEAKLRELVPEIEAVNGILGMTGLNAKAAAADLEALSNSAGASEEAFAKMLELTDSKLTILKNNVLAKFSSLGEDMLSVAGQVADSLNEAFATGRVDDFIRTISALIAAYGTYKAVLLATSAIQKSQFIAAQISEYLKMGRALGFATANQIAFNAAAKLNPYTAIASAIAAAVGALIMFNDQSDQATRIIGQGEEAARSQAREVNTLVAALASANTEQQQRLDIVEKLRSIHPDIVSGISAESVATEQLTSNLRAYNDEQVRRVAYARLSDDVGEIVANINTKKSSKALLESDAITAIDNVRQQIQDKTRVLGREISEQTKAELSGAIAEIMASEGDVRSKAGKVLSRLTTGHGTSVLGLDISEVRDAASALRDVDREIISLDIDMARAEGKVEQFVKNFKQSFATTSEAAADPKAEAAAETAIARNKAYWEKIKADATRVRDALSVDDAGGKMWVKLSADIAEANANMAIYDDKNIAKGLKNSISAYDSEIKKLKELQNERAVTHEKWRALQDNIDALEGAKMAIVDPAGYREYMADTAAELAKLKAEASAPIDLSPITQAFEAEEASWTDYLGKYGTYAQKRVAIAEKYNRLIAEAETGGQKAALAKEGEAELKALSDSALEAMITKSNFYKVLFGDIERSSVAAISSAVVSARALVDTYQKQAQTEGRVLSPEEVKAIAELERGLTSAENKVREAIPNGLSKVSKGLKDAADMATVFSDELGTSISNIAEMVDGLSSVSDGYKGIKKGIADIKEKTKDGGKMSFEDILGSAGAFAEAAGAIIGGVTKIFKIAAEAEKRHQKALLEIAQAKIKMQMEYNQLLFEQNLLLKEASSIFGTDEISRAINSFELYRQQLSMLDEQMKGSAPKMSFVERLTGDATGSFKRRMEEYERGIAGLSNIKIKTGHKKTGLFGWGKGRDLYSSIMDVYPDIIDAEGELNVQRAKAILSTQELSSENKMLLQDMINLAENSEKAMDELNGYLESTFGSLGPGVMDAIVDGIRNGTDAWAEFGKAGASVLENLGRQIAYELFFSEKFKGLQKQLTDIYGSDRSPEQIAADARDIVASFYNGIGADMENAEQWLKKWQDEARDQGLDLWKPDADTSSASLSGQIRGSVATEQSVSELGGIFRGQWDALKRIDMSLDLGFREVAAIAKMMLMIAKYTGDTADNTKKTNELLAQTNTRLDDVIRNTNPDLGSY